mgnify:FL=1
MKRILSLLLTLALLCASLPANAAAETLEPLTEGEIRAACSLIAMEGQNAVWQEGDAVTASLNALQVQQALTWLLSDEVDGLIGRIQDSVQLAQMGGAGATSGLADAGLQIQRFRNQIAVYRDELEQKRLSVYNDLERLESGGLTRREQLRIALRVREDVSRIQSIRSTVASQYADYAAKLQNHETSFEGVMGAINSPDNAVTNAAQAQLLAQAGQLTQAEQNAIDAQNGVDFNVLVLSGKQFGFVVRDEKGSPLSGVSVKVSCSDNPRAYGEVTTGADGLATFLIKDFEPNDKNRVTVDVVVQKHLYGTREMRRLSIRGGSAETIRLEVYAGKPFLRLASYNSNDILSQTTTIYSTPKNNATQEIEILVDDLSKKRVSGTLYLCYQTAGEDHVVRDVEEKRSFTTGTSVTFRGEYARTMVIGTPVSVRVETPGFTKTYDTRLMVKEAVVEAPEFKNTSALSFTGGGLGLQIPDSIPFIGGTTLSLDIPGLPAQLVIDPTGYVQFAYGKSFESEELNWKKESERDVQQRADDADKQNQRDANAVDNKVYRNTGASDRMKVFGDVTAALTVFGGLVGRINADTTRFRLEGTGGVEASFKGGYGWQFLVFGGIPVFAAMDMTFALGATFGLGLEANLPGLGNPKFLFGDGQGVTINMLTELGVSAGVGVRNFISVALRFFGSIAPQLKLTNPVSAAVTLAMGLDVTAQFILMKWSQNLWHGSYAADSRQNGGTNNGRPEEGTKITAITQSGQNIPSTSGTIVNSSGEGLTAETEAEVFSQIDTLSQDIQYVTLTSRDGKTKANFAFFITPIVSGQARQAELVWYNLDDPKQNGKVYPSQNGDEWRKNTASDYAFAVSWQNDYVALAILSGRFAAGSEKPEESRMALAVMQLSSDGKRLELTRSSAYRSEGAANNDDAKLPKGQSGTMLTMPTVFFSDYTTYNNGNRQEKWFMNAACNVEDIAGGETRSVNSVDLEAKWGNPIGTQVAMNTPFVDTAVAGSQTTRSLMAAIPAGGAGSENQSLSSYYRLYATKSADGAALELSTAGKRYSLDQDVVFMSPLDARGANTAQNEFLFYIKRGVADDGSECFRLMGAQRMPSTTGDDSITVRDYDVTMYAEHFQIAVIDDGSMYGLPYLYWTESVSDGESGKEGYRVKCVRFDRQSNTMTAPFPLVEISNAPNSLYIRSDGTGFYTTDKPQIQSMQNAAMSQRLMKFTFALKTDVELTGAAPYDPCLCAGDYAALLFSVKNTGNLPVSRFSVNLMKQGETTPFQTITVDCRNPVNGSVNSLFGTNEVDSAYSVSRVDSIFDDDNEDTWLITSRSVTGAANADETTEIMHTDLLMPGGVHVYQAVFKVPEDWNGQVNLTAEISHLYALVNTSIFGTANSSEVEVDFDENGNLVTNTTVNGTLAVKRAKVNDAQTKKPMSMGLGDLMLDCQPYVSPEGEEFVRVSIVGRSETDSTIAPMLTAELDGRTVFSYRFTRAIDEDFGYTLDIPAALLLAGRQSGEVTLTITDNEAGNEFASFDNHRTVTLGRPLVIARQPESVVTLAGGDVSFEIEVYGGRKPYTYQWQRLDEKGKWVNISGATEAALNLSGVTMEQDDMQLRCVVRDSDGQQVISDAATLTVWEELPQTGDTQKPLIPGLIFAAAVLAMMGMRRKKKRV